MSMSFSRNRDTLVKAPCYYFNTFYGFEEKIVYFIKICSFPIELFLNALYILSRKSWVEVVSRVLLFYAYVFLIKTFDCIQLHEPFPKDPIHVMLGELENFDL